MTLITLIRGGARIGNSIPVWAARFEGDMEIADGEIIPTPYGVSQDAATVRARIVERNPGCVVVVAEIEGV